MEIYIPKLNQHDADNETPNFETRNTSSRDIENIETRKKIGGPLNSDKIYNYSYTRNKLIN